MSKLVRTTRLDRLVLVPTWECECCDVIAQKGHAKENDQRLQYLKGTTLLQQPFVLIPPLMQYISGTIAYPLVLIDSRRKNQ